MANYEQLTPIDLEREHGNNCSKPQLNQGASLQVQMAIVKNAVDLHGGSIEFDIKVGLGTTFTVSIATK